MDIGFFVDNLGPSQFSFELIHESNKLLKANPSYSVTAFTRQVDILISQPNFPIQMQFNAWGWKGIAIATSYNSARVLKNVYSPKRKFLYVWNLDWMSSTKNVTHYMDIYDSDLDLIARSEEHYEILKTMWKEPLEIIEDFNYEQLAQKIAKYS